ncbi:MAG: amidohydrolase [Bacteroidales bacterium]|nr:amidohydrolase [Bacteroidales bacterium]
MKNIVLILSIIFLFSCNTSKQSADLLVYNTNIYTVDSSFSVANAMVIKNGKIIDIGMNADIKDKYISTQSIDLKGKYIYPGFYDAHCHFYGYGTNLIKRADLKETKSFDEILQIIQDFNTKNPNNPWLEARGWDQNDWELKEFPDNTKLDELFPNKPVFLIRIDGHAALVNSKALELAKIDKNTIIDGGEIKLKNGKPTGILIDNAVDLIYNTIPDPNNEMKIKALMQAQDSCFKVGLTTVDDAGLEYDLIMLIDSLQKAKQLEMQIYAMLSATKSNLELFVKNGIYKTDKLNVRSIKLYADGALGSRGALLLEPYTDKPLEQGLQLTSNEVFDSICAFANANNYQVNTHAIGDSAVRFVLHYYAKHLKQKNDKRWRIEHSQIVNNNDFDKYGEYNIIPSIQPTHATSDMYWADERVGNERLKGAYAYQQLLQQNAWLPNGSDFPIESINPLFGFFAAVARQDHKNYPENGFQSENALTREQALKAMTIWAAKSNFEENEKGSLEINKKADFVVLSKNLMEMDINEVPKLKVEATYIAGKKVYSK